MKLTYRKDYKAPDYKISDIQLDFTLDETKTRVVNTMHVEKINDAPLFLNGRYLELISLKMDGKDFTDYTKDEEGITLFNLPASFCLEIQTQINPKDNSRLMGLYLSKGVYCTQCEPEGFRNITYYLDHPDVLSLFTVIIHADRKKYPVLLSNGNKIKDDGDTVVWQDPFKKPSYLFALVAGDLDHIEDSFKTMSGKNVALRIYCEHGKKDKLYYAMDSLKRAMKWDEERFGREYDLDLFNIVAVSDFSAGAMENKSLNIFNDSCLMANEKTETDATFATVESVVAHEYFHNWSGDRVTARDWFNLSLKEGFTVFRDQSFSADMRSKVVQRIDDVSVLKRAQFLEDDGPLAHPVRPESFATIENFYTSTVYEKGAELIRMQEKILGKEGFRKGCDLYFSRHDGQAVTIDDFVKCMEDANQFDLKQFMNWYSFAGRPTVTAEKEYDDKTNTYKIHLKQSIKNYTEPLMIPLQMGLLDKDGKEILSKTLLLTQNEQDFVFENITEEATLSINRSFTAPITLKISYTDEERLRLVQYDTDLFNRYEIGQEYATDEIIKISKGQGNIDTLVRVFGTYLSLTKQDPSFVSRAMILPALSYIGERTDVFDVDALAAARHAVRQKIAETYQDRFLEIYNDFSSKAPFSAAPEAAGKRAVKNMALAYLSAVQGKENIAKEQYFSADNMTDEFSALSAAVNNDLPFEGELLDNFYQKYKDDALVINRWLALQARKEAKDTLDKVKGLMNLPLFDIRNPNKVYALIGGFAANPVAFHVTGGKGYEFLADTVIRLNAINPQVAERMVRPLVRWKHFDADRQQLMKQQLERIAKTPDICINLQETVTRALKA